MKAEVLTDPVSIAAIRTPWRELAELQGNAFITPEWFGAWHETLGEGQEPRVVAVRHADGDLAGVMPLAFDPSSRPRALRFAGAAFGDRFGIAAELGKESAVAIAAISALEEMDDSAAVTILHRIDSTSDWPHQMVEASGRRLAVIEQSPSEEPYAAVDGLDWDEYLMTRSQKFRQRVGRGLAKALDKAAIEHRVRQTASWAELEPDLETLFRLHDLRRGEGESSISSPEIRAFLAGFSAAAFEQGWLRLRILELDGQPAAAYLAWRIGSRFAIYQSGFDPAHAKHSAGMFLLNETVRAAIEEDASEVDMLLGEEPYKVRFATGTREVRTLTLVPARHPSRLLISAEATARRRGRNLAQRPGIGKIVRSLGRRAPGSR